MIKERSVNMENKKLLANIGTKIDPVKRTRQMQLLLYLSFLLNLILLTIFGIGYFQWLLL